MSAAQGARAHGALSPPRYLPRRDAVLPTDGRSPAAPGGGRPTRWEGRRSPRRPPGNAGKERPSGPAGRQDPDTARIPRRRARGRPRTEARPRLPAPSVTDLPAARGRRRQRPGPARAATTAAALRAARRGRSFPPPRPAAAATELSVRRRHFVGVSAAEGFPDMGSSRPPLRARRSPRSLGPGGEGEARRGEAGPGPAPAAGCPMVGPGGCTSRQYAAHNSGRKIEDQQPSWQQAPLSNGVHKKFRSAHSYNGTSSASADNLKVT